MQKKYSLAVRSAKKRGRAFVSGIFSQNPVLIGGAGLYMVLSGSTSLTSSWFLFVLVVALTVPVCVLCWLAGRKIAVWLRLPFAFLLTAALYLPLYAHMRQLYPQSMQELGLCGVLVAADSLILMRAFAPEKRPLSMVLIEALGGAVGFAVVLFAVSGIWNILEGVEKATAGAFRHARIAVGLIIVALLAALRQYGTNRHKRKKRREILR